MTRVAIYGRTCSGKTTVAKAVAEMLSVQSVRHCGEVVKRFASDRGVKVRDLTLADHRDIDAETMAWARYATNSPPSVAEGSFLNYVLADSDYFLVELVASPATRQTRGASRIPAIDTTARDLDDSSLACKLYAFAPRSADISVQCDALDIATITLLILKAVAQ